MAPAGVSEGKPPATAAGSAAAAAVVPTPVPVPASEPAVAPLLIVPVDHDLRPSVGRTVEGINAPNLDRERVVEVGTARDRRDLDVDALDEFDDDEEHDDVDDLDLEDDDHDELAGLSEFDDHGADDADGDDGDDRDVDATASIDPLLRMFNRNDT